MAGYPAHAHAAKVLENLNEVLAKASGDTKAKIEKVIADLDPIKDNKTFMRTQKAERLAEAAVANSEALKSNPADAANLAELEAAVGELAERVRTMVIRMT
jgi:hypothetical protein